MDLKFNFVVSGVSMHVSIKLNRACYWVILIIGVDILKGIVNPKASRISWMRASWWIFWTAPTVSRPMKTGMATGCLSVMSHGSKLSSTWSTQIILVLIIWPCNSFNKKRRGNIKPQKEDRNLICTSHCYFKQVIIQ